MKRTTRHRSESVFCCSFCGKSNAETRIVAGPGVNICAECAQTACDIVTEGFDTIQPYHPCGCQPKSLRTGPCAAHEAAAFEADNMRILGQMNADQRRALGVLAWSVGESVTRDFDWIVRGQWTRATAAFFDFVVASA